MRYRIIRVSGYCIIAVSGMMLGLGAILYRAAAVTGAESDYTLPVTWWSALRSVFWPATNIPFLQFIGVAALSAFSAFVFFRLPRVSSALLLFLQSVSAFFAGGSFGVFFLRREFEKYHFDMDGEKLGENWFTYETIAVWSVAAFTLAILRIMAPATRTASETQPAPKPN